MLDETVVASLAARLDISRVHHEIDVIVAIDFGDKPGERRFSDRPYGMSPMKANANGATPLPQSGVC